MKTRKIITTSFLSAAFLLANLASPASAETAFTDIPNTYAKDAIYQLVDLGIINGTGNGKFNPNGNITRQDFAIVLSRTLNLNTSSPPQMATFKDVSSDSYAFAAVEAVYKAGLVSGIGNGKFAGAQSLTREQMAVIFVNALGVDATGKGDTLSFTDSSSVSPWAKDYVAAALEYKLMTGNPDGSFDPSGNASRQQMALVTSKFITKKTELEQVQAEIPSAIPEPEKEPVKEPEKPVQVPSTTRPENSTPSTPSTPSVPSIPTPEPNHAPIVKDLEFKFFDESKGNVVGNAISIDFKYEDKEQDLPKIMYYKWYRSLDANGTNKELIPNNGFNHYTPVAEDIGMFISVEVTPIAATGTATGLPGYKVLPIAVTSFIIPEDITPPSVDISKFEAFEFSDQLGYVIMAQESAVSEEGSTIRAYRWKDLDNNGSINSGELDQPVVFEGLSNTNGSVGMGVLGILPPGKYKYVITATDESFNESEKSLNSSITFTVTTGEESTATLDTPFIGFEDNMIATEKEYVANSLDQIRFAYATNEIFENGTLEITAEGITFGTDDSYTTDGETRTYFNQEQISNGGHTVTITGVNGIYTELRFQLQDKIIPQPGSYFITLKADADGVGSSKSISSGQSLTLISKGTDSHEY